MNDTSFNGFHGNSTPSGSPSDPADLPPQFGTGLAIPAGDSVASTLVPLIERAAIASDSLSEALASAHPTDADLRGTLGQITELLERADRLVPGLGTLTMSTAILADQSATTGADDVRAMMDTAVENLGARCQMQLDLVRTEIDCLAKELTSRLDTLTARVEEIAQAAAPATTAPVLQPAIEESLGMWESQVGELLRLFREKAEQAMTSVDEIGRRQAAALDALCERAERLLNTPGRDAGSIVQVLDEVVSTIEPWRGLLIEGKCGPEIAPAIAAIVDRVRSEVQGDIGRLDATVSEVVAFTSRLADRQTPTAVAEIAAAPTTKAKPTRVAPPAKVAPSATKSKPSATKSRNSR